MRTFEGRIIITAMFFITLLVVGGCGGDDSVTPTLENNKLILDFRRAEPLPSGWAYQIWAFCDGEWVAGGMFNLDANLDLIDLQSASISGNKIIFSTTDLTTCDSLAITIESAGAASAISEGMLFLISGTGSGVSSQLTSPMVDIIDIDDDSAQFIMSYATPSDADTSNELSGVWFTRRDLETQGLDTLPEIPAGFIFEGWVRHDDIFISTGQFTSSTGPDDSHQHYTNISEGPMNAFPGEDFLINPPAGMSFPFQITEGDSILVSIEPVNDPWPDTPFLRWLNHYESLPTNFQFVAPTWDWLLDEYESFNWPSVNAFITND